jgi:hypothetical protein
MGWRNIGLAHLDSHALAGELATWRASIDSLATDFREMYGENDQVIDRTEQVAAAIQRLERALARRQLRSICACQGAS